MIPSVVPKSRNHRISLIRLAFQEVYTSQEQEKRERAQSIFSSVMTHPTNHTAHHIRKTRRLPFVLELLISSILMMFVVSCEKGRILTSITGSAHEILVVVDTQYRKTAAFRSLLDSLQTDIPGLPQSEPTLSVSICSPADFTSMLKPTRNILIVEINPNKYTHNELFVSKDRWAEPQSVLRIATPSSDSLQSFIRIKGRRITDHFVQAEADREIAFLRKHNHKGMGELVKDLFGFTILIPTEISLSKKSNKDSALWLSSGNRPVRQDLLIYTYPYTSQAQLRPDSLDARRDSVCRHLIAGPVNGSYMGTEKQYDHPVHRQLTVNGAYCDEARGLWKVIGNVTMGGPYVSRTFIDQKNQRIITVEGFVYAPQQKKRAHIRQLEACLQTFRLEE